MARKRKDNKYSMVNGIRMTKDGKYEAAVYVGQSSELNKSGKPKSLYEWVRGETYNECKDEKRKLEGLVKNKQYSNVRNMFFTDYAEKWLDINKGSVSPTTYLKNYKLYVNTHFTPFFGHYRVKDITEFLVKEYINKKLKGPSVDTKAPSKKPKGLSPTTVRKHFFLLSKMLYDAMKDNNPCRDIVPPAEAEYTPTVPTDEEFELIHATIKGLFDEPIVLLAGWCALREGEVFCLKTDDIISGGEIRVDESMAIGEDGYNPKKPKTRRSYRTIVVKEYLFSLLKKICSEKKPLGKVVDIKDPSKKPEPILLFDMNPDSYSRRFAKIIGIHNDLFDIREKYKQEGLDNHLKFHGPQSIAKQIHLQDKKLPDIRFHDLRHYHTTVMYENDIPDQYAAERMGDDIRTMKSVYQHLRLKKKTELDAKVKTI